MDYETNISGFRATDTVSAPSPKVVDNV